MTRAQLNKSTLTFLTKLSENNNREWFNNNKNTYLSSHQNLCDIADALIKEMTNTTNWRMNQVKKVCFAFIKMCVLVKINRPILPALPLV